jgi:transposase
MIQPVPDTPFAVGVDIGKGALHVCVAIPAIPIKNWAVQEVSLKDPNWADTLLRIVPPGALVLHEPTGWAYSLPLRRALEMREPRPNIWLINHVASAASRRLYVSRAKNDTLDARAIARIAQDVVDGQEVRGVRPDNTTLQDTVLGLRLLLNYRRRLTKLTTRLSNQIDALAHSIWPILAQKKSLYLALIERGAVTPEEILQMLAAQPTLGMRGTAVTALRTLADALPCVPVHPTIRSSIATLHAEYAANMAKREALQNAIEATLHADFPDITRRWSTVPGAGPLYIASLIVATNGLYSELTAEQFKAACGVAPNTGRSGSVDKTRKGRGGSVHAKDALHMWALSLVGDTAPDTSIRRYFGAGHNLAHCKRKLAEILSGIARNPEGAWRG